MFQSASESSNDGGLIPPPRYSVNAPNPRRAMLLCKARLFLDPRAGASDLGCSDWSTLPRTVGEGGGERARGRLESPIRPPAAHVATFQATLFLFSSFGGAGSLSGWGGDPRGRGLDGNWCFFWVKSPGLDREPSLVCELMPFQILLLLHRSRLLIIMGLGAGYSLIMVPSDTFAAALV